MYALKLIGYQFTYPGASAPALPAVDLTVNEGELLLVCGETGSGKTTLLKSLKPELAPVGQTSGEILFGAHTRQDAQHEGSAMTVGFVAQSPDNQTVMDSVEHELAFGLENLNTPPAVIRRRMAEMVAFFGMEGWIQKKVHTLSGGQKQILNLAAVMLMQPEILVLDEPAARLDPVAAKAFWSMLKRINDELGTTVIMSGHHLEDTLQMADRVLFLDKDSAHTYTPGQFIDRLRGSGGFLHALPASTRLALRLGAAECYPLNVREGREWLRSCGLTLRARSPAPCYAPGETVLEARDVWYRYGSGEYVLRDMRLSVRRGEIHAILGGNGSGKSTLLRLFSGVCPPARGKIKKASGLRVGLLPQEPDALFVRDTLYDELCEWQKFGSYTENEVREMLAVMRLERCRDRHPYDLSGGERQKAALAKLLLLSPDILLLDEPDKGLDAAAVLELAELLRRLREQGKTLLLVTHEPDFAARTADRCSLMFMGGVACTEETRRFFAANHFYTTGAAKVTRGLVPGCMLEEEVENE